MDKNKFWLGGRLFNTASPRLGAPTQRKARPQDGRPNATQGTSARWAPKRNARHVRKLGAPTQRKARPEVGCPNARPQRKARPQVWLPNATQGTSARWSPKRKTHPQRKRPHKGALGQKTRWRMDKNKFWLGGRIFNTASRHVRKLGGPTHVRNANARHVHKLGGPTHVRNANARHVRNLGATTQRRARPQDGLPNAKLIRNENIHTREH
jgi:hypothetical protein